MPDIQTNGIHLHYEEHGAGAPLLLLMGLGSPGTIWEGHVRAWAPPYRCLTPDNRGAGRSEKPVGPYSTAQMAQDTLGLLDALMLDRVHVAGISMGSAIAQELAIAVPDRVHTLTLVCPWPRCDAYTVRIFEMLHSAVQTMSLQQFVRLSQLWVYTPDWHATQMHDLLRREQQVLDAPDPMPAHAYQAQCAACIAHDTLDRLHRITAPTLITCGDRDVFTPLHYSEAIADRIDGATLLVFEGAGHAHHWEQQQKFDGAVMQFLEKYPMG
jgi:pimeloyl-ACP methyl ester carboxylesterase